MQSRFEGLIGGRLGLNTRLYRIVKLNRLEYMCKNRLNSLSSPSKWDDTFEDLLGKSEIITSLKGVGRFDSSRIYAQCWSLHSASDAMWKLYSGQDNDGVRMTTTVGKLLRSLKTASDPDGFRAYIGRVDYLKDYELKNFASTHFRKKINSLSEHIAEAYLKKRKAFSYENEVRIIFHAEELQESGYFDYEFDINEVVSSILVNPGKSEGDFRSIKKRIREMGFAGVVKRSLLYSQPKGFVFKFGSRDE